MLRRKAAGIAVFQQRIHDFFNGDHPAAHRHRVQRRAVNGNAGAAVVFFQSPVLQMHIRNIGQKFRQKFPGIFPGIGKIAGIKAQIAEIPTKPIDKYDDVKKTISKYTDDKVFNEFTALVDKFLVENKKIKGLYDYERKESQQKRNICSYSHI